MNTKRKICIVTGTRAEFGLLTPLMESIENDEELDLQVVVTGMHLSPDFGNTYKEVEKKFKIDKKIEILFAEDTSTAVSKSMGLVQTSFPAAFEGLAPDLVVVLGDRYEIFAVAATAMIMKIPIAHLSGGEVTEGAIDDSIRHAITKMSHLHFVATEEYRNRVLQLGENPKHVFNFGELGLDNIANLKLLEKKAFEESIDFRLDEKSLLITYHPTTLENKESIKQGFVNLLSVLDGLDNTSLIFTKSNSDEGGRMINTMIEDFVEARPDKAVLFASLGQLRYLSALQHVDAVVGNTSSGIVEAPSFKLPAINIGNRQKGRIQGDNVINTSAKLEDLKVAFKKLYSVEFQASLKTISNPYFKEGNAALETKEILKSIDLSNIVNKKFFDKV